MRRDARYYYELAAAAMDADVDIVMRPRPRNGYSRYAFRVRHLAWWLAHRTLQVRWKVLASLFDEGVETIRYGVKATDERAMNDPSLRIRFRAALDVDLRGEWLEAA